MAEVRRVMHYRTLQGDQACHLVCGLCGRLLGTSEEYPEHTETGIPCQVCDNPKVQDDEEHENGK